MGISSLLEMLFKHTFGYIKSLSHRQDNVITNLGRERTTKGYVLLLSTHLAYLDPACTGQELTGIIELPHLLVEPLT